MHQPRSYASLFLSSTKRASKRVPDTDAEQLTAFLEGRFVGSSFGLMQKWPLPRSRDSSSLAKPRNRPPISLAKPPLSSSQVLSPTCLAQVFSFLSSSSLHHGHHVKGHNRALIPAFNVHRDSILIFDALVDCLERVVYRKAWERFEGCC